MVKNVLGGKKNKRRAKFTDNAHNREILLKGDHQEYGMVEKMLGDMRCLVLLPNKHSTLCHIRGRFKRRMWINQGDVVLIAYREFEEGKADIIHKYNQNEVEYLKSSGLFTLESSNESQPNQYTMFDGWNDSEEEEEDEENEKLVLLENL